MDGIRGIYLSPGKFLPVGINIVLRISCTSEGSGGYAVKRYFAIAEEEKSLFELQDFPRRMIFVIIIIFFFESLAVCTGGYNGEDGKLPMELGERARDSRGRNAVNVR